MKYKGIIIVILVLMLVPLVQAQAPMVKQSFTVVLDAGHGGHDPGNMKNGFREKDIALKIVLEVGKILQSQPGIKVIYTRDSDVFVDLFKRGQIANKAKADLFVSVHCNAHHTEAHGTETFVLGLHANRQNFEVAKKENSVIYLEDDHEVNYAGYDINSPESVIGLTIMQEEFLDQSIALAKNIQDAFTNQLRRKDRGVKQAGFIVLHQTYMPSVLVETGFLSYLPEGNYLNSAQGKSEMANAIANAVIRYRTQVSENVGDDFSFELSDATPLKNTASKENNGGWAVEEKAPPVSKDEVVFRIQLAAGSNSLEPVASNFKGLSPVFRQQSSGLYKYFYGQAISLDEARQLQQKAIARGYSSAFIVAFRNGERIDLESAVKTTAN